MDVRQNVYVNVFLMCSVVRKSFHINGINLVLIPIECNRYCHLLQNLSQVMTILPFGILYHSLEIAMDFLAANKLCCCLCRMVAEVMVVSLLCQSSN